MANLITFRGTTILADGEGVFSNPQWEDSAGQEYDHEPLARGLGTVAKALGTRDATITVGVTFFTKDSGGNSVSTIVTRLQGCCATAGEGTLAVTGMPSFANCVMLRPRYAEPQRRWWPDAGVAGYALPVQLVFVKSR